MFFSKKNKADKKEDQALLKANRDDVARALDVLFAKDYISKKRLYWENFVRGIFFGAGGLIGATLLISLLLWALSFFDQIPFVETTRETIESGTER